MINMDVKEYIDSGILELYVAGRLSEDENLEVYDMMLKHPEVTAEVLAIEAAVVHVTALAAPAKRNLRLSDLRKQLQAKVIPLKPRYNWLTYTGWAASVVLGSALFYFITKNNDLTFELESAAAKEQFLEDQISTISNDLNQAQALIEVFRDREITTVPLGGQEVAPEAFAQVYWDKKTKTIYLDAKGLPEAPEGKVYQVWSLTLDPLTPTSLGTIDDFNTDANKVFTIENANASEAFGITLEPAGGSESPTLEQLYTLGVVQTQP